MASNTIRPRAWLDGDIVILKMLITHPMETGRRKNKNTGELIAAHFIESLTVEHNEEMILDALLGPAISKNPFIQCKFKGAKTNDTIKISWLDNKGQRDSIETKIK